jgi:hypothetical protein
MTRRFSIAGLIIIGAVAAGYLALRPEPVAARHVPITTKIVFNREIAQIFQKKCFQCHTDGNVSVPLTTYKEARPWAVAIKEEILERRMPPWGAAAGYGHFSNDVSLTGREISLILSWADGGAPSGVLLVDEDKQPVFVPSLNGWENGEPDLVLGVAADKKVAPDAPYAVERFTVSTGLKSAKWLRALQLDPADRRGIRYAAVYDARNGRWLGTWTPTSKVSTMPDGAGVQLPANARLTVEVGYKGNPDGGEVSGAGDLGLYFFEKAPAQAAQSVEIVSAKAVNVAPAKIGERVRAETTIKSATTVAAIWPQLGAGARSLEVTAIAPDGVVNPLLWVNNYRADWPSSYVMKEAVALAAGTRLVMTAYYDNRTESPVAAKPAVSMTTASPVRQRATHAP